MRTRTIEALLLAGILICGGTALGIWIAEAFSGPSAAHRHAMEIDKSAKCASVHAGATTQQCIAGGRWYLCDGDGCVAEPNSTPIGGP